MYEKFSMLLQASRMTAAEVSRGTGINQTVFSEWKKGKSQPKIDKLQKISVFFGVPIEYFTGESKIENQPIYLDVELQELLYELRKRPELRTLVKETRDISKEDVEIIVTIIKRFKKGSGNID